MSKKAKKATQSKRNVSNAGQKRNNQNSKTQSTQSRDSEQLSGNHKTAYGEEKFPGEGSLQTPTWDDTRNMTRPLKGEESDRSYQQHNQEWRDNYSEQGFGGTRDKQSSSLDDNGYSYDSQRERGMSQSEDDWSAEDDRREANRRQGNFDLRSEDNNNSRSRSSYGSRGRD